MRWFEERRNRLQSEREKRSSGQSIEKGVTGGAKGLTAVGVALALLFIVNRGETRVLTVGIVTFLAALLVGCFAGFLFGLPRDAPTGAAPAGTPLRFLYNSNLLKVSDFVTTLIVGLTLIQIGNVLPALGRLGNALSGPLGSGAQSPAFGIGLAITGFLGGAILMYLWTTVRLREHLELSEMQLRQQLKTTNALEFAVGYIRTGGNIVDVSLALAALPEEELKTTKSRLANVRVDPAMEDRRKEIYELIQQQVQ